MKSIAALATTAVFAQAGEVLSQNARAWTADLKISSLGSHVVTPGLKVRGEIGWHTHGSGDKKDVDIDLAIIVDTTGNIDPLFTTMILWGLPITGQTLTTLPLHEVGMLEYKRGSLSSVEKWNLTQGMCTNYAGGDNLFNLNGSQWSDLVTVWPDSYTKVGATQDTSYWSENVLARVTESKRIVLAMSRPALSNTIVFKAGGRLTAKFAFI